MKRKRIKWENITFILMLLLDIICIVNHIILNGIYKELLQELVIYGLLTYGVRYIVKDIRTNKENWKIF